MLSNNASWSSTELLTRHLVGLAMDALYEPPTPITLDAERLDVLAGVYTLADEATWTITREDARLVAQWTGWGPIPLVPIDATTFCFEGAPLNCLVFTLDAASAVSAVAMHSRSRV